MAECFRHGETTFKDGDLWRCRDCGMALNAKLILPRAVGGQYQEEEGAQNGS